MDFDNTEQYGTNRTPELQEFACHGGRGAAKEGGGGGAEAHAAACEDAEIDGRPASCIRHRR
jgi:hypothetical protein